MTDPNTHAARMAELHPGPLRGFKDSERYVTVARMKEALAYADSLAAALEAERAKVAELEREVAVDDQLLADRQRILDACPCPVHGACIPHVLETLAKLKAAEEKLRAAERVILDVRGITERGLAAEYYNPETKADAGSDWEGALEAIKEALSAFDAINPDGSTGGPNPSK